ncbi:helix-turn-helix domain-containing protein [Nocardia cyriacigeorgica]|nr:helix-turn-helix transcriptional regulator [Nocardia cyriacigeorgica]MBF6289784.1 helix-turn-helix domain-containing protein [Nocardia cyriacigeorgica]
MPTSGNTVPRRQLGKHLREMRQAAGLSIAEAARQIGRGAGTVQRLETGHPGKIHIPDIVGLCELYDEVEQQDALLGLAKEADEEPRNGGWWHEFGELIPADFELYVGMEAIATSLMVYRPDMVSGLFQTAGYSMALERAYAPGDSLEELERRVRRRMGRQKIFKRKRNPVSVTLILDEAVLHRAVGGRKTMAAQLRHLADMPPNVVVRVLPFGCGMPTGKAPGPFTVLDFAAPTNEPTTVYVESYTANLYYDRPDSVDRYRRAFTMMQAVALDPVGSKCLLRTRAKEYERER